MRQVSVDLDHSLGSEGRRGLLSGRGLRLLAAFAVLLATLYLLRLYSYILFHSLSELFSIAVALAVLAIAWHTRRFTSQRFLLFLGLALGLVAVLDTLHLLAYKGMGVFTPDGSDLPTQLWIAGRYVFTLAMILAPLLITAGRRAVAAASVALGAVWMGLLLSVFAWPVFPHAFVDGQGLTAFKRVSEYAICAVLLVSIWLLYRRRGTMERGILLLLIAAVASTIVSELSFTLYADPYGLLNLIGHYLKILAFFFVYLAIVDRTLVAPYALIFRTLQQRDEERDKLVARLDGISQVTEAAMRTLETDELIDSVLARLLPLVGAQSGVILLSQENRLAAVAGVGFRRDRLEDVTIGFGEGVAGRVAATGRPIFVEDVQNDPRVSNPLFIESGVQSLLAVPLRHRNELIGVMHVDWTERRSIDESEISFVELLADRVAVALSNADEYGHQKEVAEVLQREMLSMPGRLSGVEFAHVYRSASRGAHVGGDFYDVFLGADSRVWMLIGDVSGHGVQAATTALLIREITRAYVLEGGDVPEILRRINTAMVRRLGFRQYATMFLGALDAQTGSLEYCSAGHPPGLVLHPEGEVAELGSRALPIGAFADSAYAATRIGLEPGETLVLFTDGLTEARRGDDFFGEDRLKEIMRRQPAPAQLPRELLQAVEAFTGGQFVDDLAILCLAR